MCNPVSLTAAAAFTYLGPCVSERHGIKLDHKNLHDDSQQSCVPQDLAA